MISNIDKIVQNTNLVFGIFLISLVLFVICIIIDFIIKFYDECYDERSSPSCSGILLIAVLITFSIFFLCSFNSHYYSEVEEKINTIVEENISVDAKKQKVITYLEAEKFFGNISRYENLDNNFKVDYIYNFEITDSESDELSES